MRPVAIGAAALLMLAWGGPAPAADLSAMETALRRIELDWARVTYQVQDKGAQASEMQALAEQAAELARLYPDRAEPLIWDGIAISSEAAVVGPLSALGLARQAREAFEKAGRLDFRAMEGAVPTSLGALYYRVPGFPLGFGDDAKARRYLQQGVEISPDGLDSNYYYGDFLYRSGEYRAARTVLEHALAAPPDPVRTVWDAGRRAEIRTLLAKVEQKLAGG